MTSPAPENAAPHPSAKDKKAITITRIVGWGSIAFSLFTVVTVLYVGFLR